MQQKMSFPKTNRIRQSNFRKLQKEWYQKLKESGFEDLEHFKMGDMVPKILALKDAARMGVSVEQIEDGFEYYRSAGIFLHEYCFATELDRKIWEMHSNGAPLIEIKLDTEIRPLLKLLGATSGRSSDLPASKILVRLKKEFLEWVRETNKDGASR